VARSFEVSEFIDRPPEMVWDMLTDLSRATEWMPGISDIQQMTEGPIGRGTRLGFNARGRAHETQVTEFEAGRRLTLASNQGGVTATYAYKIEPEGSGSRVSLDAACVARGLWRVLHPLISYAMRRADSGQVALLKAAFERE